MRLLLDTNVLIDYFASREPYVQDALRLRIMQEFGDVELWASIQSFADIAYVLRNETDTRKLQDAFLASLDFLRVCALDQDDLKMACREQWVDFEDCLIEQCSRKVKAEFLLTRDSRGFSQSTATTLSPAEFFSLISEQYGLTYETVGCSMAEALELMAKKQLG
jgi:predicted nucleic acid-binding protein